MRDEEPGTAVAASGVAQGGVALAVATLALGGVFAWPALRVLANVYWNNTDYSHGLLVPLIAGYFAYERREGLGDREYRSSWLGMPLVVMGMGLMLLGYCEMYICPGGLGEAFFCALGLLVCVAGMCVAFGGLALAWALAFPLGYLIFAVPWPLLLSNRVTVPLRLAATAGAAKIIRAVGAPVLKEGNVLHLANASLNVSEACSGIRSLGVMLAAAAGLGYWMRCGAARVAALCIVAVPIAMSINFLRVVLTGLLVAWIGPEWASGSRHEACGLVAFAVGLSALVGLVWLLAPTRRRDQASDGEGQGEPEAAEPLASRILVSHAVWVAIMFLIVGGTAVRMAIAQRYRTRFAATPHRRRLADVPSQIEDFDEFKRDSEMADREQVLLMPSDSLYRGYRARDGTPVDLCILYWQPFQTRSPRFMVGPHAPDLCYGASGWRREREFDAKLAITGFTDEEANVRLYRKLGDAQVVVFWTQRSGSGPLVWSPARSPLSRVRELITLWNNPTVKRDPQYYVRIGVDATEDLEAAKATAIRFARAIAPILPECGLRGRACMLGTHEAASRLD